MRRFVMNLIKGSLFTLYAIGISALLFSVLRKDDGIGMVEKVEPISITGTVSIDGGPLQIINENTWLDGSMRSLVVVGHFSHEITNGESLILWPRNLRIKLYVNDQLKISTGQRNEFPQFIKYAGNSYKMFYIGDISTKDVIKIAVEKAYVSCRINVINAFFHSMYAGTEGQVYHSIMEHEIIQPLIGLGLILIGALVLVTSVFEHYTQFSHLRQIYYLGWFCVIGGITYAFDSSYEFIDLLFPHPVFNTLADLCCIPILLFSYLLFLTTLIQNRIAKITLRWITILFLLIEFIPLTLQALGILDLHVLQDQYVTYGGILVIFACILLIFEIVFAKRTELIKVLIATLPLMITLIMKVVNIFLEHGVERSYLRIGILISCILLLQYSLKYVKRSMQLIEQEKERQKEMQNMQVAVMLSQIQPHFLYNALNTLQHICEKDGALAAEAIGHFSRYLRGNMASLTQDRLIPFEQELEHVKHYLFIEQLRFGDRVRIKYDLEVTNFLIPTLTLQPIVENAIRHGITKQAEGGIVWIITKRSLDEILIIVSDNGVGSNIPTPSIDDPNHVGLNNVRKRLKLQCNGTIDFISKPGSGTQVTIRLKGSEQKKDESHGRR